MSYPNNNQAEKAILSAIIQEPRESAPIALARLRGSDFYSAPLGKLFDFLAMMDASGKRIEMATIPAVITQQLLVEPGGQSSDCLNFCPC